MVRARFEEDYLQRTHGSILRNPSIAIAELVANAWDAGADSVSIQIPVDENDKQLIVEDDGCGMTKAQFEQRWMTLGYNRLNHQGPEVEFPPSRQSAGKRLAFGRNGVGRHGLFCFGNAYHVTTKRDGHGYSAEVQIAKDSGDNPFNVVERGTLKASGNGTKLSIEVQRNAPNPDKIREELGCRFVVDPQFKVTVNGKSVVSDQLDGRIDYKVLKVREGLQLKLMAYDAGASGRTTQQSGVAFWVGQRLVGKPSWTVGGEMLLDGRYKQAKRLVIVGSTDDLIDEVLPDWSGFIESEKAELVISAVSDYAKEIINRHMKGKIQETRESTIRRNIDRIMELDEVERDDVSDFIEALTEAAPTLPEDTLSVAVNSLVSLLESRNGRSLIARLSQLDDDDIGALDNILDQWTVQDCKAVLDEVGRRMRLVEAIEKLMDDSDVDELHGLHPLTAEARWMFGPEYESSEYVSNRTIRKAMEAIFKKKFHNLSFENPLRRPDLLVLPNASTLGATGIEEYSPGSQVPKFRRLLLLELKVGGFQVTRNEMDQAGGYIEDLHHTGLLDGEPFIHAFVVGSRLSPKLTPERTLGEGGGIGRVEATTYGSLVSSANNRLFRLRNIVKERYQGLSGLSLVDEILQNTGSQRDLFK